MACPDARPASQLLVALLVLGAAACTQERALLRGGPAPFSSPSARRLPGQAEEADDNTALAKKAQNPVSNLVSVPFQKPSVFAVYVALNVYVPGLSAGKLKFIP